MRSSVKPLAGPGATPIARGQAGGAQLGHRGPHRRAGVAGAVGVVEQEHVEGLDAAALQGSLAGHAQVGPVLVGAAQPRVGEAGEALGALALAGVEVVADGADERVVVARQALQRAADEAVGLALAVGVRGEHGGDALVRPQ